MTHGCEWYFFFATVTDSGKVAIFMEFFHYIYKNVLTSENMYLPMIVGKKESISFLILQSRFQES